MPSSRRYGMINDHWFKNAIVYCLSVGMSWIRTEVVSGISGTDTQARLSSRFVTAIFGAVTGLAVKDRRGKDANQVIWKFDRAPEPRIADTLKKAAIEEGGGRRSALERDHTGRRVKGAINRCRDRLPLRIADA